MIEWYWIVAITLGVHWLISCIIAILDKEEWLQIWAMGLLYPILYFVTYPVRAWNSYSPVKQEYKKYGISYIQYLFGKRIKKNRGNRR